jgi:hypothetical protein
MVNAMSRRNPRKPVELSLNFRTHCGILDLANVVIDRLHAVFPGAVDKCAPDRGMARGPRAALCGPDLIAKHGFEKVSGFNERQRVLMWDARIQKSALAAKAEAKNHFVFGIRGAKGLEFSHMMLLNFFSDIPEAHQSAWKWMAQQDTSQRQQALRSMPVEVMLELKLLYTAITRCCCNLLIVETKPSKSGKAWFRRMHSGVALGGNSRERKEVAPAGRGANRGAVANIFALPKEGESKKMSREEWVSEGIELAARARDQTNVGKAYRQAAICFQRAGDDETNGRCMALHKLYTAATKSDYKTAAHAAVECLSKFRHDAQEIADAIKDMPGFIDSDTKNKGSRAPEKAGFWQPAFA